MDVHCITVLLWAGETARGEICSQNKGQAVASRHSFSLEDTKVVFNGCWPHAHSPGLRNVLCLGRSPSQPQSWRRLLWGGKKPALQVLGLSFSFQKKESVLRLDFPPRPAPAPWTVPHTEGSSFFFLTVAVSSSQVLYPECEVKKQSLWEILVARRRPVLLKTWWINLLQFLWFWAHASFLRLLLCVLHKRKREKQS